MNPRIEHDEAATRARPMSADRYRLEGTYERLRRALLAGPADGRIDQPLSYWVLPTDRRLPIAFLDRALRDLLAAPLEDLMRTPGVGQKKILGFFDLLRRAIKAESPHSPFGMATDSAPCAGPAQHRGVCLAPAAVSEAVWSGWCEAILRAGFGEHALGRVAPSLQTLPTVIWQTPLCEYAGKSLAEIRGLKTHGEKRVNAILEVFGAVYEGVSTAALDEELQLDLAPRFVSPLSRWIVASAERPERIGYADLRDRVATPLLGQVKNDLGDAVEGLARERLGIEAPAPTVRSQSERLGVTRARVYQLLDDCARVMAVRWPEGRWLLAPLAAAGQGDPRAAGLVAATRTLFFPA